jgi:hypothetical protein
VNNFLELLSGGDLRSIGQSNKVVHLIKGQADFDELFQFLFHKDRLVVMRAADAIEKVSVEDKSYLAKHRKDIIGLCQKASDKELKWHLALLVSRVVLTKNELGTVWQLLSSWALDKREGKIVRVNAVQGLFNLLQQNIELKKDFELLLLELERQGVASLNARIKKLKGIPTI